MIKHRWSRSAGAIRPSRRPSHVLSLLFVVLLTGLSSPAPTRASESLGALDDPANRAEVVVLENGLTVVLLEDHHSPVVSFQMWVKVGGRDETLYTGLAHLFEHMMFRGSENIGPEEHARLIDARGGRLNAFTSNDFTVYFEDVTAESLPLVIDLEHERVKNLRIDQEILDTEREVVLEERRLRTEDSPQGRGLEALFASVWIAHPYRSPVIGWRSDVEKVTVEACREFFDEYYVPDNMVIAIVGDFDRDAAMAQLQRTFGRLEARGPVPRRPTTEPEQDGERRVQVNFDVRSPLLIAGWHAPKTGHEDAPALDVAGQILSAGRSSRLYRSLVYDAQTAMFAEGGYWELSDAGLFYAFAGVRPGQSIDQVEELFFSEVDRMRDEGVTEAELQKAKRQLEVGLVSGLDTAHALAARFARDIATFGRIRPLEEQLEAYRSVTGEDVQRVMAKYLRTDRRTVVHVAPEAEAEEAAR